MLEQGEASLDDMAAEAPALAWLAELRPLDVCAFAGALGLIAYRFLCG